MEGLAEGGGSPGAVGAGRRRGLGRYARDVSPSSPATRARAGAAFALTGGVTIALGLLAPGSHNDESVLAATLGLSIVLALVLHTVGPELRGAAYHPLLLLATALVSATVYGWGIDSAFSPLPYLWVALFAFYFLPLPAAAVHMALVAAAYAATLALLGADGEEVVGGWAATVITLGVAGLCIARVRTELAGLIESLTDAARRDPLTQVLNRRGFEQAFDMELERARRTRAPLSLVVGDLDHFKRVNDDLGHAAGDDVLRRVADCIAATKRGFDTAARIGGEEFAILAPSCDEHGAYILAERMRSEVERTLSSTPEALTISFGVATYPVHGQSADALLRAADQALYAAKRLGRNRSVISSAEVPGILAHGPGEPEDSRVELASLLSLAEALDVRDAGNATHCHRVARFCELIARELGLPADAVERLRLAGILHDVGRVGIPDALLAKSGPLSDDEWAFVRSHPEVGARMLETTHFDDIRTWIRAHHERPDGRGYPDGLEGEAVPLEARIVAVADAYEAMTSDRAHRPAMSASAAAEALREGSGTQWDPEVVEALLRSI